METKHTKGEWYTGVKGNTVYSNLEHDIKITVIDEDSDNELKLSKHIAESLNVLSETGKTTRQLADENKELLEALVFLLEGSKAPDFKKEFAINAINKATK